MPNPIPALQRAIADARKAESLAREYRALSIIASLQRVGYPERMFYIYDHPHDGPINPWVLSA